MTACTSHTSRRSLTDEFIANSALSASQSKRPSAVDSLTIQKNRLTEIYTKAIGEFIKAVHIKDKKSYDTLYFGKHTYGQSDDFPDLELPMNIENTQIRLVSPEVGQIKLSERKSLVYVNMIGWVEKERAEFILVVFKNAGEHQFDYFLNFIFNTSKEQYELEKIEFENYMKLNSEKPKRKLLYKDGKYVL